MKKYIIVAVLNLGLLSSSHGVGPAVLACGASCLGILGGGAMGWMAIHQSQSRPNLMSSKITDEQLEALVNGYAASKANKKAAKTWYWLSGEFTLHQFQKARDYSPVQRKMDYISKKNPFKTYNKCSNELNRVQKWLSKSGFMFSLMGENLPSGLEQGEEVSVILSSLVCTPHPPLVLND